MCQELVNLLNRLIIDPSLPDNIRRQILEALLAQMGPAGQPGSGPPKGPVGGMQAAAVQAAGPVIAGAAATRKLVYVHGICRHVAGYSDSMWHALKPFLPVTFGDGTLGQTRLEVLWSDLVNQASAALGAAMATTMPPSAVATDQARQKASDEIKEALRDRADQHALHVAAASAQVGAATPTDSVSGSISIPGLNCIDDFSIYLTSDTVRQQIIDRFITVVGPQLSSGVELDIISHSWGTVVAYEGLRQLADSGTTTPLVRDFFTVGAALSIGPVKSRLRDANKDGRKPANVKRWINLDARGDLVGGPLKGRPYEVDLDFVNLDPTGCGGFLGIVSPVCAHSSYFVDDNTSVNRDIFARFILATA